VLAVNIDSVNNLSLAGNEKSKLVLDASKYDVSRQRFTLETELAKFKELQITAPEQ